MKKIKTTSKLLLCMLIVAAMLTATLSVGAAGYEFPPNSVPVNVTLDGKAVLRGEAVIINSVTYVPLRSFSELMGADEISWNAKTSTATVKKGAVTVYLTNGALYISANGRYFFTVERILNINDRLFVPVRAIAEPFCVNVDWNNSSRTVVLTSTKKTLVSGDNYYNSTDLYWLSRIINAEASGESLVGQIAVGNVVLNRKASKMYPNTVYGVIFDRVGGTQFSPVAMGTIYNKPSQSSIIAAKICLDGYSVDTAILFFMNPDISTSNWISKNRPFAFTIGQHDFYY
ncbi:MAG: cell wall hydrolase [Clostridia bacterium]|nr:cell wall hydrolase [Clostridia bacterium]